MGVLIVNYGDVDGCLDCHMVMWMGVSIRHINTPIHIVLWRCGWVS